MCFTKEMSFGLTVLGLGVTAYLYLRGDPWSVYIPILYFTFMELYQYISFYLLDKETEKNKKETDKYLYIVTVLTFIHICFQPLFANMWFKNYIPKSNHKTIQFLLVLCLIAGLYMFTRFGEFQKKNTIRCNKNSEELCSATTIIEKGKMHLKYLFDMRAPSYVTPSIFIHFFLIFIPPLILGVRIIPYLCVLFGILLAYIITSERDEIPATWCTFSVPTLLYSIFATAIR